MLWAYSCGQKIEAQPGRRAQCPSCCGELVAKCGEHVAWHWAHKSRDCDPWSEPESKWHVEWKRRFPDHWQEVVVGSHRADVQTPHGVIEFQKSAISSAEIREREGFYRRMVWVLDVSESNLVPECDFNQMRKMFHERHPKWNMTWQEMARLTFTERQRFSESMNAAFRQFRNTEVRRSSEATFRWYWPRKSWKAANKTVFLDFGDDTLGRVLRWRWAASGRCWLDVKWITKQRFVESCSKTRAA